VYAVHILEGVVGIILIVCMKELEEPERNNI
jgi:hypothetical protein